MQCITPTKFTVDDCLACSACIPDYKNSTKYPDGENIIYVFSTQALLSLAHFFNLPVEIFERKFTFFMKRKLKAIFLLNMSFLRSTHLKLFHEEFKKKSMVITSSCPAIVIYAERKYPALIEHLSETKSLHQLAYDYAKNKIKSPHKICALAPCLDKKLENVPYDFILTVKEFHNFLIEKNISFSADMEEESCDEEFKSYSVNGSSSGGYVEYLMSQSKGTFTVKQVRNNFIEYFDRENNISYAKVFSLPNLLYLMKYDFKKYQFIELFLCKGCCDGPGLIKNTQLENMWNSLEKNSLTNFFTEDIYREKRVFDKFKRKQINFTVDW